MTLTGSLKALKFNEAVFCFLVWLAFMLINITCFRMISSGSLISTDQSAFMTVSTDHESYVETIEYMRSGMYRFGYNNSAGISLFYYWLNQATGLDLTLLAFIVNNVLLVFAFLASRKLLSLLALPTPWAALLFVNPATIYFSWFINKESFSLLAVIVMLVLAGTGRYKVLMAAILAAMCVRFQLGFFGLVLLFLCASRNFFRSVLASYLALSLVGALIVKFGRNFDSNLWGDGLVNAVYWLNYDYSIGSLLLNPARAGQYLADLVLSVRFIESGGIALYALRDLPSAIFLVSALPCLAYVFINLHIYVNTRLKIVLSGLIAFTLVQLMHPVIHARYLFPVMPLFLLIILFVGYEKYGAGPAGRRRGTKCKVITEVNQV